MTQIYFAQAHVSKSNKPIKIGLSHDVAGRIYDMQVGCPVQLTLLASFEGLARHERLLHKILTRAVAQLPPPMTAIFLSGFIQIPKQKYQNISDVITLRPCYRET